SNKFFNNLITFVFANLISSIVITRNISRVPTQNVTYNLINWIVSLFIERTIHRCQSLADFFFVSIVYIEAYSFICKSYTYTFFLNQLSTTIIAYSKGFHKNLTLFQ